ncbi:short-chain dehydrogenase [Paenibacillus swuensis]|uniref:Short-chain dehydrogenase n=1 Tax=Paenibacillus swuensis TaxID=1178515 RepID=A0A172TG69_9BACL|nr:glucose 1-dehydrogenase [Paenibacillus swuensis]ANE45952.1 short-chain dehydrogenase [Paenibacillus swuensis]
MKLRDKVAVITGGASGIGLAAARLFAQEGAKLVIGDTSDEGQQVVNTLMREGHEAMFVYTDVSKEAEVRGLMEAAVSRFGRVDVLFANAGIGEASPADEVPLEKWQRVMDVNLTGVFLSDKYAIQQMMKQGGGVIINNASILGHVGQNGVTSNAAAKGGVVNMTRSLGVTYAKEGIRINAVCPGYVETPMLADASEPERRALEEAHPIGRLGRAEEVAKAVLFLASDDASFVVGSSLMVDGGYTAQ